MFVTLLKKQLLEMVNPKGVGSEKKKKPTVSKGKIVLYAFLVLYLAAAVFFMFFMMMDTLCKPLCEAGLGWLYFALGGISAVLLAVIGTVFMTQSMLYEAKDNELLLSMPIPPSMILLSRTVSLYLQNLLFGGVIFLSTIVAYAVSYPMSASMIAICVLLIFILPLFSLVISAALAYVVALITSRMRSKTVFTMVLSLGFLAVYFWLYSKMQSYLQLMIVNSAEVAATIKASLYPFYLMGKAAAGDWIRFLIFTLIVGALFALVYCLLSKAFISIATTRRGADKIKYKRSALRTGNADKALLYKECRRFTCSAVYMMNCGLSSILFVIGSVVAVVKRDALVSVVSLLGEEGLSGMIPVAVCLALCFIASMNMVTAPSVSMEGKSIWILQTMPIDIKKVFSAKLKLHMLVTAPAAALCAVVLSVIMGFGAMQTVLTVVLLTLYILFVGEIGLIFNLLLPKLDWVNEAVAVKQGTSTLVTMLIGWFAVVPIGAAYVPFAVGGIAVQSSLTALNCIYLTAASVLVAGVCAVLWIPLSKWGREKFIYLQ